MKKLTLMLMVVFLLTVTALAGCGNNDTASNNNDSDSNEDAASSEKFELGSEDLEFSFYGHYDWYTMPAWGGDESSAWIKENKKVNVTAVSSGGNAAQKFSTMIVGNDLPDVMWLERGADVEKLRSNGMLVALDPYLDKYPNLKEWLGEAGINMLRSPDGKLYQIPNWYTSQPNGNAGYVVNKKIYTELGSPKLETTEDLYKYLQLVKENYPNVVPFETYVQGQGIDVMYSAFKEDASTNWLNIQAVPTGDQLTSIFADDTFIDSLKYASKLFREKLISQDTMTQNQDAVTEKVMNGRVAVFASPSPTEISYKAHASLQAQDPEAGYFMIWPIHKEGLDANKIFPGTYTQLGWNVSVITKAAENPEKIFAFLDWYTGPEGQSTIQYGPEGKYWDGFDEEGYPVFTEEYVTEADSLAELQGTTTNLNWVGNTVFVDTAKSNYEMSLPEEDRSWITQQQSTITWKTQQDATEFINLNPAPESEEGLAAQRVFDIYEEARAKAIYASSDEEVEEIMSQAHEDAMQAGYQKVLDYKTQKWQENLSLMNGK